MSYDKQIIFKGNKDGVTILFPEDIVFDEILLQLEEKVKDAGKFFDNVKTVLTFKGKQFSEEEERKLLELITTNTSMQISFLKSENNELLRLSSIVENELSSLNITKFHRGSLRNGQKIDFDGSVVIVGDVNPGAEIKASGNIIILGALKGLAHAGAGNANDSFISAIYMAPVQLRIGDIITLFPEENKKGDKPAEYAFIKNDQIFVMPLS